LLFGVEPFFVLTYLLGATVAAAAIAYKFLQKVDDIDNRGQNQNKALIEMAAHTDSETERLHPERSQNKIKPTIERILAEE